MRTTIKTQAGRLPTHRPPTHPGEFLEDMLSDRALSVAEAARRMNLPPQRIYDLIKKRRNATAETAILLAGLFEMSAQFWMRAAADYELWEAMQSATASR